MTEEQFTTLLAALAGGGEWSTALGWLVPLVIAIAGSVSWLVQEVYKSRLQRELETHKSTLNEELQRKLGAESSQRRYEDAARSRLYETVGPLRFQLLLACRDAVGRIQRMGTVERYVIDMDSYYGRSTAYRILRPIAVCDLIEETIAIADFSVDKDAVDCLKLRRAFQKSLSGEEPLATLSGADWSSQIEHVFADRVSAAGRTLIVEGETCRIVRYDEFETRIASGGIIKIAPFGEILSGFEPQTKPILWVRLVSFALCANTYIGRYGPQAGFDHEPLDVRELLNASGVAKLQDKSDELSKAAEEVAASNL